MAYHNRNRKKFYEAARHTMEIEMMPYCDTIAKDIGCYPTLTKVLWKYGFGIWRRVLFGVPTPMQVSIFFKTDSRYSIRLQVFEVVTVV